MDYRIVADSSCEVPEGMEEKMNIDLVPFNIAVDGVDFRDDKDLVVMDLIQAMRNSPNPVKTSCPSPGDFLEHYRKADNIFVVTISANLSGTYNSAELAREMMKEEDPDKFVHVFNAKSASVGETLTAMKIYELIEKGLSNSEIVEKVEKYISETNTFFILESLDNLVKNGRISKTKGLVASVLNVKPIMGEDGEGNIELKENVRGSKKAFNRLVEIIGEGKENFEDKILAISHANALEKAMEFKEKIEALYNFKEVIVLETRGLSTAYAYDGGVIVAY